MLTVCLSLLAIAAILYLLMAVVVWVVLITRPWNFGPVPHVLIVTLVAITWPIVAWEWLEDL